LETKLRAQFERRRKNIVGAPVGQTIAVFIDDVHLPSRSRDQDVDTVPERTWVGEGNIC
jgi:hypothetical protein